MRAYRKEKVASLIHEIVSEAILRRINDPRVSPLTTVTRVELSGDLLIATVYLSVCGEAAEERRTVTALRHAGGFIQRMVAHELELRQCPELRFETDEKLKKVKQTLQLLDQNRRDLPDPAEAEDDFDGTDPGVDPVAADLDLDDPDPDDSEERDA